jgi:hypothetical protein
MNFSPKSTRRQSPGDIDRWLLDQVRTALRTRPISKSALPKFSFLCAKWKQREIMKQPGVCVAHTASQSMIPSVGAGFPLSTANCIACFLTQSGSLVAALLTGVLLHVCTPTFTLAAIAAAFAISVCCMCLVRREPLSLRDARNTNESELLIDRHLLRLGAIYALLYLGGKRYWPELRV